MKKKKNSTEIIEEKNDILNNEETLQTDKETQDETKVTVEEVIEKRELTLQEKYDELNDRILRLHAEFDNYRKRTIKERIELSRTASEDVLKSFLPVFDDLERAIKSMENISENNSFLEGIILIYNKFKSILSQKGVEEIITKDEVFNTDFHEAVTNIAAESEEMKGKIVEVVEKGYLLNGKVIRFAKVIVGN